MGKRTGGRHAARSGVPHNVAMTETDARTEPLLDDGASSTYAELLSELGGVLESSAELSDYLQRVVHAVRRSVEGCDEVGVTLLTDGRPHTAAYTTVTTLEIDAMQYALDEGPCLDSARHRRENRVRTHVADDRWPRFSAEVREDGMRALMAVPLLSDDECVGALNLYAWHEDAFDDFDAELVHLAAARAADAVVAVTKLDGANRLAGQLEQAMASRAVIEQAKGVIMSMQGVEEHEAFQLLRKLSQDENVKVRVLAERVVQSVKRQRTT